jgi:hemoglobin/transferrin/lactoferrin receptor protein
MLTFMTSKPLALGLLISSTQLIHAETTTLPSIIVTAAKTDQIEAVELKNQSPHMVDYLQNEPGVLLQKTGPAQGSPYIRGFTGYHVMMLNDGFKLNNSVFRSGPNQYWNTINGSTIDQLVVSKGSASARYGSGAVASVEALSRTELQQELYTRVASADRSLMNTLKYDFSLGKTNVYLDGTFNHFGDMHVAELGTLNGTGFDEYGGGLKITHPCSDGLFTLSNQFFKQNNASRWHSTVDNNQSWEGTTTGSHLTRDLDQKRNITYLRYDHDDFYIGYARQYQDEVEDNTRRTTDVRLSGFTVDTDSLIGQWNLSPKTHVGYEVYVDHVDSFYTRNGVERNDTPVGKDSTYLDSGIYADHSLMLGQTEFRLGARGSYAKVDVGQYLNANSGLVESLENHWSNVSFGLSAHRQFENLNVFAGVNQGFRAPNLSDLTTYGTARSGIQSQPAPDLEDEKFTSYEVGFKWGTDHNNLELSTYYTDIRDTINSTIISGNTFKVNSGKAYVDGVDLVINNIFEHLDSRSYISYQYGKDKSANDYLSRINPLTIGNRLKFLSDHQWSGQLDSKWVAKADKLSTADNSDTQRIPPGGTPVYFLMSAEVSYAFKSKSSLSFGIENLFDEDYRVHGSGQNSLGRNFYTALTLAL